jgi:hypothetical protein
MTFEKITAKLAKTFEGQATVQADTFQGKMARLSVAFNEAKETVGAFILDAITPIVEVIVGKVVPAVQSFIDGMGGKEGLGETFKQVSDFAKKFFTPIIEALKNAFDKIKKAVMDNKDEFKALFDFLEKFVAPFLGGVFKLAIEGISSAISLAVNAVGKLISGFKTLFEWGGKVAKFLGFGDSKSSNISFAESEPSSNAFAIPAIMPTTKGFMAGQSMVTNNITVNGAIDSESAARQIVQVLNQSSYRGSLGAGALVAV